MSTALSKVYSILIKLSPQIQNSYQGETNRVEFLRKVVIGYEWATEQRSRISTYNLSLQIIYGELDSALYLSKETYSARISDKANYSVKKEDNMGIFYHG